MTSVDFYQTCN